MSKMASRRSLLHGRNCSAVASPDVPTSTSPAQLPDRGITLDDIATDVAARQLGVPDRRERAHRELEWWRIPVAREAVHCLTETFQAQHATRTAVQDLQGVHRLVDDQSERLASLRGCSSSARTCGPGSAGRSRARSESSALLDGSMITARFPRRPTRHWPLR